MFILILKKEASLYSVVRVSPAYRFERETATGGDDEIFFFYTEREHLIA